MAATIFNTNGHDYSKYIERSGYGWTRNDLDSEKTTRLKNGDMRRSKITEKRTCTFSFIGMSREILAQLDDDMRHTTFDATYLDLHGEETRKFYCTSMTATLEEAADGNEIWSGASITIVEV